MTQPIYFRVWAPSEQVFRDSWVAAGVAEVVDGKWQLTEAHRGMHVSLDMGWPGLIVKTPAVIDGDGNVVTPAVMKDGIFIDVKVYDPALIQQFTNGLEQYETVQVDGLDVQQERNLFDRTHAAQVFGLSDEPRNPNTNFPPGKKNAAGVTYCDWRDVETPAHGFA